MTDIDTLLADGLVIADAPLGPLTTYKAGGPARFLATIDSLADLERVMATGLAESMEVLVLGRGSNLVVADSGFHGLVIRLGGEFLDIEVDGTLVTGGGAAPLPRLARAAVDHGVLGLEFFVGVPGSVGGAVRQNAGCFGVETTDRLISAQVIDIRTGDRRTTTPEDLELAYRHSNLKTTDLVLGATFQGERGDSDQGRDLMREVTRWRRDNQPGGTLNAGSVFKNPSAMPAGRLIDELGLKGARIGGVSVSTKHANFFVAGPDATSDDIRRLVEHIKDTVFERSGTMLEPEIQFVGFEE
jgi:UDP-N-acetylmuramate dehydrogenase